MNIRECYVQMLSVLEYINENDDGVVIALGYNADEMVKNAIKNAHLASGVTTKSLECTLHGVVFGEAEVYQLKKAEYERGIEDGKIIAEHGTVNWQT